MRKLLGLLCLILISTNAKPVNEDPTISLTNTGINEDLKLDSIGLDNNDCDTCHALYSSPVYNVGIRIIFGRRYAEKCIYPMIAKCLIPCFHLHRSGHRTKMIQIKQKRKIHMNYTKKQPIGKNS